MSLRFEGVGFGYEDHPVLRNVSMDVHKGEGVGVLGRNGAGKTTLLRLASGVLAPSEGRVSIENRPIREYTVRERAKHVAMMEQSSDAPRGLRVRDVVELGRFPHRPHFAPLSESDRQAIAAAMTLCEVENLQKRYVQTLSGGEYRRVLLAMTLAQETPVLLLDEPFAHLDPAHVVELVRTIQRMERSSRVLLIAAHDVNAILRVATRLVVLSSGEAELYPNVAESVRAKAFETAFGAVVDVEERPNGVWVQPRFDDSTHPDNSAA
jgi:iron complex transport system ATP-binding protein